MYEDDELEESCRPLAPIGGELGGKDSSGFTVNKVAYIVGKSTLQRSSPIEFLLPSICVPTLSSRMLDSAVCCCFGAIKRRHERNFELNCQLTVVWIINKR